MGVTRRVSILDLPQMSSETEPKRTRCRSEHAEALLGHRLQVRKLCRAFIRDDIFLAPPLLPSLRDLVGDALPSRRVAEEMVHEALQAGRDGFGPGPEVGRGEALEAVKVEQPGAVLLGLLEAAEPVGGQVDARPGRPWWCRRGGPWARRRAG